MAGMQPVLQEKKTTKKTLQDIQIPNSVGIGILVAAIAIGGLIFWLISSRDQQVDVPAGTQFASSSVEGADVVEVLPQTTRGYNAATTRNPFGEERLGEVRVTGIVSNSLGKSTAILEIDDSSFIVNEGEQLPQSEWSVSQIASNSVTFSLEGSEKTVFMDASFENSNSSSSEDENFTREAEEEVLQDPDISSSSLGGSSNGMGALGEIPSGTSSLSSASGLGGLDSLFGKVDAISSTANSRTSEAESIISAEENP